MKQLDTKERWKYSRYLYNCWLLGKPQSVRDTTVSLGETKSVLNTIVQIGPQRELKVPEILASQSRWNTKNVQNTDVIIR